MVSSPTSFYLAICLMSVLSVLPLTCLAADDPTTATGLSSPDVDMSEMSRDGKATASSLVHMHFLYMQCLGSVGRRCANATQYSCAKIVRSHSADTAADEGPGCLTVSVRSITTDKRNPREGVPCFAEAWLPKTKLLQLSPGNEFVPIVVTNQTGENVGVSTVDLSAKGLKRYPWVSVNLLHGNAWLSSFIRLCPAADMASDTGPFPIISPARLGGRKRHSFKIDEKPFVMTGFAKTSILRLDEFLRGAVPLPDGDSTVETTSTSSRERRQTRLTQLIRRHGTLADREPATTNPSPPSSGVPTLSAEQRTTRPCNRTALTVSFSELSPRKNIVLFPANLQIFDCVGVCTNTLQAASAHAFLMRTVRSIKTELGSAVRQQRMSYGCCVPVQFESEPINLLVDDGQTQIIFPITNPTVKSCGCT